MTIEAEHVAALREAAERQQFESFMRRHTAQLLDFAKRYVGALIPEQREQFLAFAIEQAWQKRAELKPRKSEHAEQHVDVLRWWEDHCLRPAALSRPTWTIRTWDRRREFVSGRQLGRRIFG